MGGLDIFRAVPDSLTGRWHIENMKFPVNSQSDDFGMTFEPGAPNRGFSLLTGEMPVAGITFTVLSFRRYIIS